MYCRPRRLHLRAALWEKGGRVMYCKFVRPPLSESKLRTVPSLTPDREALWSWKLGIEVLHEVVLGIGTGEVSGGLLHNFLLPTFMQRRPYSVEIWIRWCLRLRYIRVGVGECFGMEGFQNHASIINSRVPWICMRQPFSIEIYITGTLELGHSHLPSASLIEEPFSSEPLVMFRSSAA